MADRASTAPRVKQPLPVIGKEKARRVCGHDDEFKILKGEPPAYAARRKQKWLLKRCASCVAVETERIKAEAQARRGGLSRAEAHAIARKQRKAFRLPDSSKFTLTYRAADPTHGTWSGTLALADGRAFCAEDDGVHRLLILLGKRYVEAASEGTE